MPTSSHCIRYLIDIFSFFIIAFTSSSTCWIPPIHNNYTTFCRPHIYYSSSSCFFCSYPSNTSISTFLFNLFDT
nr:MAG TPA: hypothetical protein [Caudoviricetes sp.]